MKQSFKEFSVGLEELDINEQLSMYNDYEFNYEEDSTTISINIVEVASEMADKELNRRQQIALHYKEYSPYPLLDNGIMKEVYEDDGETVAEVCYTEEAQDVFNELYDEYYNFLSNFKIK